jgi:RimJ/RimL family protein N-acetyltransferase
VEGRKVVLRPIEREDHHLLQAWQNDPEVAYWMDYRMSFSLRDVEEDQERTRHEGHPFGITLDGRLIGKCGLNQFRWESRVCALYVYVGEKDVWGQGLGRDAVMALLCVAFGTLGMERVELSLLAENERARRVYEACGFTLEGRLKGRSYREGRWHDTAVMSVDRATFDRTRAEYGV